jgi:hypothetical protein
MAGVGLADQQPAGQPPRLNSPYREGADPGGEQIELGRCERGHRGGQAETRDLDVVAERRRDAESQLIASLDPHRLRGSVGDPHPRDEQQTLLCSGRRRAGLVLRLRVLGGDRVVALGRR